MIYNSKASIQRFLHFNNEGFSKEEAEKHLALIVRELTGEWVTEIPCAEIQAASRYFYDELVYFGPGEDLKEGGIAEILVNVSMVDRYNFDQQRVGFYYNNEPECLKENDLEQDKRYIVFYNGENSIP
jgi:hypothetical protein